jgi:chemotaxis protein MotB
MSRRDKGGGGGHGGSGEERWLLPYADMITLLLGLFIVLFAMSTLDAKKFDSLRDSLAQTFDGGQVLAEPGSVMPGSTGALQPVTTSDAPSPEAVARLQDVQKRSKEELEQQAEAVKQVATEALGNDVKVTNNQRGIELSLAGDALFDTGRSDLKPEVREKLARLEAKLEQFHRELEITGHTDGQPVPGDEWGNWRLSGDRAEAVAFFFFERGYDPSKVRVVGLADTDPAVAPPKRNPQKPMKQNRRIVITILAPGADDPRSPQARAGRAGRPAGARLGRRTARRAAAARLRDRRRTRPLDEGGTGMTCPTAELHAIQPDPPAQDGSRSCRSVRKTQEISTS